MMTSNTWCDRNPATLGGPTSTGSDPAKRDQILDGAKRSFLRRGFDAACIDDIAREASVSKGTIYVYFENKEALFVATFARERVVFLKSIKEAFSFPRTIEAGLYKFGVKYLQHMTDNAVIAAMRAAIGVYRRMPHICSQFLRSDQDAKVVLQRFLAQQVDAEAINIHDLDLAAGQFLDLVSGSLVRCRLSGIMASAPSTEEIERVVRGAVSVFLAAYLPQ